MWNGDLRREISDAAPFEPESGELRGGAAEISEDQVDLPTLEELPDSDLVDTNASLAESELNSRLLQEWTQSRGITTEYNVHFNQQDFLKEQARNGDMLAAQMLGYQTLGTESGNEYLTDAATLGSTQALIFLSEASKRVAEGRLKEQLENQSSDIDQHEYSIQALEYLFVAEIRGDNYVAPNNIAELMNQFTYSADDVAHACENARERYLSLEGARIAKGLPAFDNSLAPVGSAPSTQNQYCAN